MLAEVLFGEGQQLENLIEEVVFVCVDHRAYVDVGLRRLEHGVLSSPILDLLSFFRRD